MEVIKRIQQMQNLARKLRADGKTIGFVPTMGALHQGHLSLMQRARQMSDVVIVSIFINPIQFGANEDFDRYPRDLAADAEMCATRGVDYIFAPLIDEIYPEDFATYVVVEGLSDRLCGASREGHFRGVTTVVTKLLNITHPHYLFLGRKDAQQAIIVKRMARDLTMDTEVIVCSTLREEDGLAMSSRNAYLSASERQAATVLYRALEKAQVLYGSGVRSADQIQAAVEEVVSAEPLARVDYVAVADARDLEPLRTLEDDRTVLIALAVFIGKTRLIDNVILNGEL